MYDILAQIPGRMWMGSIFSVVGVIYLLVCFAILMLFSLKGSVWAGVGVNIFLFLLGILLVYCAEGVNPEKSYYRQYNQVPGFTLLCLDDHGCHPVRKSILIDEGYWPAYSDSILYGDWPSHNFPDLDWAKGSHYDMDKEPVYSMHVNGLSPWIFHPSCLYWCPGVIAVPFFLLGMFAFGGVRR